MTEAILDVRDLVKHFPVYAGVFRHQVDVVKAVDGVSFCVEKGEVLGMVGESGCGKSTTGRAAIRLIEPTSGRVFFKGQDLLALNKHDLRQLRPRMQMVFQNPYASLNPRKTIGNSIGEALLFHGLVKDHEEMEFVVVETLQQVGIDPDTRSRYPHQFSGGQQQRICIGRAIALKPDLIICDEAVSALDVSVQAQILNLLEELKETLDLSYLFISHDLSVVRHLCDRVAVLNYGKIVECGTTAQVFTDPQDPYTRELLSAIPITHPNQRGKQLRFA